MSVPTDITGEQVAENRERKQRHPLLVWAWSLVRLDFVGIPFGALFFCLSLTPSLLPRDWLFQGLIGGLNAAIGYGIGVFAGKLLRRFVLRRRRRRPPSKRVLYWLKGGHRSSVGDGQRADADTCGGLAASGVVDDGHGRAGNVRLSAHPDHRRARRGRMCRRRSRADRSHQDDGPVLHPALASA